MALQHLRSSTADKRPTPGAMSDGQLAMNTNLVSPGLFLKDSNGDSVKIGPVHVGTTAPNATPGAGGQAGNSKGELWLDTTGGTYVLKTWDGTAWRSVSVTGDFVETTGDTMTGALVMDDQGQVRFRETTANGTSYVALQAAASVASNKTITLPDATGTVVLSGAIVNADINTSAAIALSKLATGALPTAITVASANIVNGAIVNADINASAAITDTKLATISTAGKVSNSATTATSANTASTIVARDASGNFTAGTITANLTGTASNVTTNANLTGDVTSVGNATSIAAGVIVNADINASAAIALSKLATGALPTAITVASANIVNATIVNADINASAAIALSKLATGALPTAITVASANIVNATIVNADISASAAIVDTKLATIATAGKVSNSATTATSANTASAIVARDASGNFTANNISAVGDVTAFASDIRLKTNIKPIDNAISKVLSLNGFTYSFNEIGESLGFDAGVRHSGVSAQDVQEVLPEAVCPAPVSEDYLTVKYEKIVPLLIEAIKEQQEQINILIAATRQQ